VLSELTGEEETDGGLDFAGGESVLLVVADKAGGLAGNLLEDVVDEGVHDGHGLLGDTELGVDLLEDSVDVDGESLTSALLGGSGGLLGGGLGGGSGSGCLSGLLSGGHCVTNLIITRGGRINKARLIFLSLYL
jgi:hypothetical protein